VNLDEQAPLSPAPNALGYDPLRRQGEIDYFRTKMREFGVPPVD